MKARVLLVLNARTDVYLLEVGSPKNVMTRPSSAYRVSRCGRGVRIHSRGSRS